MHTPLQPIWDIALRHWDEVLPTPGDYAACIAEVNEQFQALEVASLIQDPWTDADVLLAAFYLCGYRDVIPHLEITHKHVDIAGTMCNRYNYQKPGHGRR